MKPALLHFPTPENKLHRSYPPATRVHGTVHIYINEQIQNRTKTKIIEDNIQPA